MAKILTITLNPTIDVFGEADAVGPTRKTRLGLARHEPGGGGINVARVVSALGGEAESIYLSGGEIGQFLARLLAEEGIRAAPIETGGQTRIALMVRDRTTGLEYRFLPEGPAVNKDAIAECLRAIATTDAAVVVASGSLPRGALADTYADMAKAAASRGIPFVLDTSGGALKAAIAGGHLFLIKPSRDEMEQLAGTSLDDVGLESAARQIVAEGSCRMVAVTLGDAGAMLVTEAGVLRRPAIRVETRSAVGAGDSFLGAMVWALSEKWPVAEAFLLGMAAGAAAAMNADNLLCRKENVAALYRANGGTEAI